MSQNYRVTKEREGKTHEGCEERGEVGERRTQVGMRLGLGAEGRTRRRRWGSSGCCWRRRTRVKKTPKGRATGDANNHEGCNNKTTRGEKKG